MNIRDKEMGIRMKIWHSIFPPPLSLILGCKQRSGETTLLSPPSNLSTSARHRNFVPFPASPAVFLFLPSLPGRNFIRQSSRKSWNGCRLPLRVHEASSCWPKICIFKLQPLSPPLIERVENFLYNSYADDLEGAIVILRYLRSCAFGENWGKAGRGAGRKREG